MKLSVLEGNREQAGLLLYKYPLANSSDCYEDEEFKFDGAEKYIYLGYKPLLLELLILYRLIWKVPTSLGHFDTFRILGWRRSNRR